MKPCDSCKYYFKEDFEPAKTCHIAEYGEQDLVPEDRRKEHERPMPCEAYGDEQEDEHEE